MEFIGFTVCVITGVLCFGVFYKCIDWFETI